MASLVRHRTQSGSLIQRANATQPATPSTSSREKQIGKRRILLCYHEIPEWHQDNDYILHGYRPESKSARACFASWLYLHNETFNIYSHLLPGVLFLLAGGFTFHYLQASYPGASIGDRLVFAFFLLTAATCLGASATYHTLMNHSVDVSNLWLRLDLVGIVVLTLGDFVSGIYVGFYCEPTLQKVYWAMILVLGSVTVFILVNPKFQGRRWRTFRVCTFIGTGLSGIVPITHGIMIFGFAQMRKQSGMMYYIVEGLLLMLGAVFYTTRIPEALNPVHLLGILSAFDYNSKYRQCGLE